MSDRMSEEDFEAELKRAYEGDLIARERLYSEAIAARTREAELERKLAAYEQANDVSPQAIADHIRRLEAAVEAGASGLLEDSLDNLRQLVRDNAALERENRAKARALMQRDELLQQAEAKSAALERENERLRDIMAAGAAPLAIDGPNHAATVQHLRAALSPPKETP